MLSSNIFAESKPHQNVVGVIKQHSNHVQDCLKKWGHGEINSKYYICVICIYIIVNVSKKCQTEQEKQIRTQKEENMRKYV